MHCFGKTVVLVWLMLVFPGAAFAHGPVDYPEPQGEQCVEPEDDMRRNHMEYLLHQRDETVIKGIRTTQHSLTECIECHASKNEQGDFVSIHASGQFCSGCHEYAAVSIDCFECHADKPEAAYSSVGTAPRELGGLSLQDIQETR